MTTGQGKNGPKEEILYADEILYEKDHQDEGSGKSIDDQNVAMMRDYCNKHPWIRIVALLSFWLSWIAIAIGFIAFVASAVSAALHLFKDDSKNARFHRMWDVLCGSGVLALSCAVGILSPIFGIAMFTAYITIFHPTYLNHKYFKSSIFGGRRQ